jgi:hypothetical protein
MKLGDKVRDNLTGFIGIAVAKCEYLNGCVSYEIVPLDLKEGLIQKTVWIDIQQLSVIKQKPVLKKKEPDCYGKRPGRGGPGNRPPEASKPPDSYEEG